jgi:hypothetical protein
LKIVNNIPEAVIRLRRIFEAKQNEKKILLKLCYRSVVRSLVVVEVVVVVVE